MVPGRYTISAAVLTEDESPCCFSLCLCTGYRRTSRFLQHLQLLYRIKCSGFLIHCCLCIDAAFACEEFGPRPYAREGT